MKVYIVMEQDIVDTTYYIVDCVFDTREKANDYIIYQNDLYPRIRYEILEKEVRTDSTREKANDYIIYQNDLYPRIRYEILEKEVRTDSMK